MRIAVAQINTRAGDFAATSQRIVELSRRAASDGAELLLFPLGAFTGQCLPDYASCEGFALDMGATLEGLAQSVACPCLIPVTTSDAVGLCEAMLLRDGTALPVGLMSLLLGETAQSDDPDEPTRGSFELGGLRFAVAYNYEDMRAVEDSDADVDVLLFIPERGFALDDPSSALGASLTEGRFRDDAWALDAWIVGVGSLGGYDLQVYTGSSFVLTPKAELIACAPAFEEAFLVADIDASPAGSYEVLEPELYDRSMHLWEALALGLRDLLEKQGETDVSLVLDGRLCSSVLATLASDAIGPTRVHAFIDATQGEERRMRSERLARSLHLDVCKVDAFPLSSDADEHLRHGFVQAQLASLAHATNSVPLASFDKTYLALEASLGTGNAASLAPLADVYRTDLIELAHLRNTISPVMESASVRSYDVPSIEGLDDAEPTPEARMRRVDVTLATIIEWERSLSDVVSRQGHEDVCLGIAERLVACELARMALPPCIAVSSRTVREMRVPLGMAWCDHVRKDEDRLPDVDLLAEVASSLGARANEHEARGGEMASMAADVEAMLEKMQAELLGSESAMGNQDAPERQVGELLGLLRDILQDGGFTADGMGTDVPFGPLTWGSPFSEN